MLHVATTETKQRNDPANATPAPEPRREFHSRVASPGAYLHGGPENSGGREASWRHSAHQLQRSMGNRALMRMVDRRAARPPATPVPTVQLQRKCACGGSDGECESCKEKREQGFLQRKTSGASAETGVPPIVHEVLRSPGQPLDAVTRTFFENRLDHDFSDVRVHTGEQAGASAKAVNALAYTVGSDVVFGAGQYAPSSSAGRRLLAHELAHVVQQRGAAPAAARKLTISEPQDAAEQQADRVAESVTTGHSVPSPGSTSGPVVQRACGSSAVKAGECPGLSGDVTGEPFLFKVGCDEFRDGEEPRLLAFAATLPRNNILEVHGFASEEGPVAFNDTLSCARAEKAIDVLTTAGISASQIRIFKHGATAGPRPEHRSVVIHRVSAVEPVDHKHKVDCVPAYDTTSSPSATNCSAYQGPLAKTWLTWTYRHNATCACENTPDNATNNCVRKCLQAKMSAFLSGLSRAGAVSGTCLDPIGLLDPACPEPYCRDLYRHHVECYRECCCTHGFIAYPAFVTMCESPFPCSFVGTTIDWFNRCL